MVSWYEAKMTGKIGGKERWHSSCLGDRRVLEIARYNHFREGLNSW